METPNEQFFSNEHFWVKRADLPQTIRNQTRTEISVHLKLQVYYILVWDRPTEVTPEAQFEMSTRSGTLKDPASYEASAARDETT